MVTSLSPSSRTQRKVIKRFEREIQDEHTPLTSKFVTWQNLLSFVVEMEEELLEQDDEELLKSHRTVLESAIVLGEVLLEEPNVDEALKPLNCTRADFEAKLIMLRHSDRMWHGDLSKEKADAIIAQVFNEK